MPRPIRRPSLDHPAAPRRRRRALAAALLAVGALAACGDAVGPRDQPLTGHWTSISTGSGSTAGVALSLALVQDGGSVQGDGSLRSPDGPDVAVQVQGTISGRVVTLVIDSEPAGQLGPALLLQAMLGESRDRLSGALTHGQVTETRVFERE